MRDGKICMFLVVFIISIVLNQSAKNLRWMLALHWTIVSVLCFIQLLHIERQSIANLTVCVRFQTLGDHQGSGQKYRGADLHVGDCRQMLEKVFHANVTIQLKHGLV